MCPMDNAPASAIVPAMTERADIAILGGGLVGPVTALTLSELGFDVVLIDRLSEADRRDPGFDGRAYAVALGSERLLSALGLWSGLIGEAQDITRIEVSDSVMPGRAAPALLHFDPLETGPGRVGTILEDRFLRRALLDAIGNATGIRHIAPASFASAEFRPGETILRLDNGRTIAARLAIAADGRGSPLAEIAGIRRIGWGYDQTGLVSAIEHDGPHHGVAHQSFFAGGPFAMLPLPGPRSSLVWSERRAEAERLMALPETAFEAELQIRTGGRLGRVKLAAPRRAHPLGLSLAARYVSDRLALVGDAAHGVHPIAGQGFNLGLRDVAALAEVLVEAGRIGEDIGSRAVLERYQRWRRFDASAMALGMDALNRLFSTESRPVAAIRDAGLALVNRLAPARRRFMAEATGQSGRVPRCCAAPSHKTYPGSLRASSMSMIGMPSRIG